MDGTQGILIFLGIFWELKPTFALFKEKIPHNVFTFINWNLLWKGHFYPLLFTCRKFLFLNTQFVFFFLKLIFASRACSLWHKTTELNWTELNWTELIWTELNWIKLKWIVICESKSIVLNWTENKLERTGLKRLYIWLFRYLNISYVFFLVCRLCSILFFKFVEMFYWISICLIAYKYAL